MPNPKSECAQFGTGLFICACRNLAAAVHCAAAAVQLDASTVLPVESAINGLVMRFRPWASRFMISRFTKKKTSSLPMMGPPVWTPVRYCFWRTSNPAAKASFEARLGLR